MKKMFSPKFILSIIALTLFAFSSCKKDDTKPASPEFYVSFKLDGIEKQYTEATVAKMSNVPGIYSCDCSGLNQVNYVIEEGMIITILSNTVIAKNITYNEDTGAILSYTDSTGGHASSGLSHNAKVTVTQLDDKSITGTFFGTITNTVDLTTAQQVTGGEFHLPIQ
jgi:hypothetical protein